MCRSFLSSGSHNCELDVMGSVLISVEDKGPGV